MKYPTSPILLSTTSQSMGALRNVIRTFSLPLVAALTLVTGFWFFTNDFRDKSVNTYSTFYYAAKAMEAGGEIYLSHVPGGKCQYVYPPLFALISIPLSHVEELAAKRTWLIVDVVLTVLALVLCTKEMMRRFQVPASPRMVIGLCCGAYWLSIGEIKTEWATGQTDTLVLVAFILSLRWMERRPWLAGTALGFGANIKYQTLAALPWMIARRRWKAASAGVLSVIAFAITPALISGWQQNLRSLQVAFAGLGAFVGIHSQFAAPTVRVTWLRSISVTSAIARLLSWMGGNPTKAMAISSVVALGILVMIAAFYHAHSLRLFSFRVKTRPLVPKDPGIVGIEWVGLMVAWLAFGPEVSRRHMFVLIFMHAAILALLTCPQRRFRRSILVASLVVWQIGLRLPPSRSPFFQTAGDFWSSIGGPGWCLLALYTVLVWSGLEWVQRSRLGFPLARYGGPEAQPLHYPFEHATQYRASAVQSALEPVVEPRRTSGGDGMPRGR